MASSNRTTGLVTHGVALNKIPSADGQIEAVRRRTIQQKQSTQAGFTLIELLIVIAIILIMASFAAPIYSRIVIRSHEAVLRDDLFTMREIINRYTLDNHKPPESLQALVKSGYFSGGLPIDPFTGSNKTWQPDIEQVQISPEKTFTGVVNVHSGSNAKSLEGTPYSSW